MAATFTYPGVYVEEIPSGVRTIAGVSTSDTAFIDFFRKGPIDRAVRITSFADFARVFGGLDLRSEASYAIRNYYLNGGSVSWVVRVVTAEADAARLTVPVGQAGSGSGGSGVLGSGGSGGGAGQITFEAASPGSWGDALQLGIDHHSAKRRNEQGNEVDDLFNLGVREVEEANGKSRVVQYEAHRNLSLDPTHPRYVEAVLSRESSLLRVAPGQTMSIGSRPSPTGADVFDVLALIGNPKADTDTTVNGNVLLSAYLRFDGRNQAGRVPVAPELGEDGKVPGDDDWNNETGAQAILGVDAAGQSDPANPRGINLLDRIAPAVFNLLSIPATSKLSDASASTVITAASTFCEQHRAFYIVDLADNVVTQEGMLQWIEVNASLRTNYAAVYFPAVAVPDPLQDNRPRRTGISGAMAGVYARTDANRGVWKAAAGTDATLRGVSLLATMTDLENGALNPQGINALRQFPIYGNVSWGARTLEGSDTEASEWKYIPVRRTALFIEESLYQGLKWVVFEPNDERLWAQIRLNVGVFMHGLFRRGAFQGKSPRDAYLVKCDADTTTQADINLGVVNILVGFAPLKPAEFVVLQIQQLAGQLVT